MAGLLGNFRKSNILNLVLRSLQLIVALVVIGLYGVDLHRAQREEKYSDGKWVHSSTPLSIPSEFTRLTLIVQVYAVVVGSMAAVSALVFGLMGIFMQYRTVALLFAWDWIMMILWAALSGVFGSMYLNEKVEMEYGIHRMKVAVGFDLTGMVLWFISAVFGTWFFFAERRAGLQARAKD